MVRAAKGQTLERMQGQMALLMAQRLELNQQYAAAQASIDPPNPLTEAVNREWAAREHLNIDEWESRIKQHRQQLDELHHELLKWRDQLLSQDTVVVQIPQDAELQLYRNICAEKEALERAQQESKPARDEYIRIRKETQVARDDYTHLIEGKTAIERKIRELEGPMDELQRKIHRRWHFLKGMVPDPS